LQLLFFGDWDNDFNQNLFQNLYYKLHSTNKNDTLEDFPYTTWCLSKLSGDVGQNIATQLQPRFNAS
jgi:hypothetical protein